MTQIFKNVQGVPTESPYGILLCPLCSVDSVRIIGMTRFAPNEFSILGECEKGHAVTIAFSHSKGCTLVETTAEEPPSGTPYSTSFGVAK